MVRFRGQAMLAAQPQHGRLRRLLRVPGPGGHPSRPQDPHPHRLHRLRPCLARLPRWSVFVARPCWPRSLSMAAFDVCSVSQGPGGIPSAPKTRILIVYTAFDHALLVCLDGPFSRPGHVGRAASAWSPSTSAPCPRARGASLPPPRPASSSSTPPSTMPCSSASMVRFRGQAMLAAQPQHGRLRRAGGYLSPVTRYLSSPQDTYPPPC